MAVYRPAGAPFNHESADVILRTTDNVDFRVHKGVAEQAKADVSDEVSDGLQVIPMMAEDSEVLDKLLRFCYPVPPPQIKTLDDLKPILTTVLKYQMELAIDSLRDLLMSSRIVSEEPYSRLLVNTTWTGRQQQWHRSFSTKGLPGPFVDELKYIPASALHRLWDLQRRCTSLAVPLASDFRWIEQNKAVDKNWVFFRCTNHDVCDASDVVLNFGGQQVTPRAWWKEYMQRAEAALRERHSAASVTSSVVLWPSFQAMTRCPTCGSGQGMDDLKAFSEVFAAEVDKVVAEVADGIKWD